MVFRYKACKMIIIATISATLSQSVVCVLLFGFLCDVIYSFCLKKISQSFRLDLIKIYKPLELEKVLVTM